MTSTGWMYISLGNTARMFRWAMIATPVYVLSFLIGLPYGAVGVATCYSIAVGILFVPCFLMATHKTAVSFKDAFAVIWPLSLAAGTIGTILHFASGQVGNWLGLFLTGVALFTYLVVALVLILSWPPYATLKEYGMKALKIIRDRIFRSKTTESKI
ncbi:MAG: hypothetical protein D6751_06435 [Deltaproteobacteria bacterium]|nr:MAG: hypothetical protein D6751_06435 [Deltaproteobacteria bacterium]